MAASGDRLEVTKQRADVESSDGGGCVCVCVRVKTNKFILKFVMEMQWAKTNETTVKRETKLEGLPQQTPR